MSTPALRLVSNVETGPTPVNGKVPPRRVTNAERRSREYLTPSEIEGLITAANKSGRHRHRDKSLILIGYRHGLRVSELIALRWDMVDLKQGRIHVTRLKGGSDSVHPLRGPELRALRRLLRDYDSPYVFCSERGGPLTASSVRKIVARAGDKAGLINVHPHQLRHSCGYFLANQGIDTRAIQAYLGHRNIQHSTRYTELAANRFDGFWKD